MKRNIIIGSIVGVLVVIAIGITFYSIFNVKHIEDTNGSDTSLVSMETEDLITNRYSYLAHKLSIKSGSTSTYYGISRASGINSSDVDYNQVEISAEKLTGIMILQTTDTNAGDSLEIVIECAFVSGNMEVVVIGPDGTILGTADLNGVTTIEVPHTQKGEYSVVLGGESAEFEIYIRRN